MASKGKHDGEEPVGWVTIRGKHFPKWKDGTIGWQQGEESISKKKEYSDAVERLAKEHTEKIMTRTTSNKELYDEVEKWANEHGMDVKKMQDDAFKRMNQLHSEAIERGEHKVPRTAEQKKASFEKADTDTLKNTLNTLEVTHRWGEPSPDAEIIRSILKERERTTSRNAKYDTSRTPEGKVAEAYKNVEIAKQAWRDAEQNKLAISKRLRNEYLKKNYGATYSQMEKKGTYTNKVNQEVGKYVMSVPEFKKAYAAEKNAMSKHVSTTAVLKQEYEKYRKLGGIQNADWYKASREWDDND